MMNTAAPPDEQSYDLQVSYTDDRKGFDSEDDEEAERREKAAKQELIPAFMESQEGYDDEVEKSAGPQVHRTQHCSALAISGACLSQ